MTIQIERHKAIILIKTAPSFTLLEKPHLKRQIFLMINRLLQKLDPHMQEIVKGASLAFILKALGSGLAFGLNIAIARLLGAEGAGIYFLALSVTAIGSVIGRVGLDNALLRFVAIHSTHNEWNKLNGVYKLSMRIAIIASGLVTIVVFISSHWIASTLFDKPELSDPLRWMSLTILPFSCLIFTLRVLKV